MDINQKLIDAGKKYNKTLLVAPMASFEEVRPYFNIMTGIQGTIIAGTLANNSQFRPYRTAKDVTDTSSITPREMTNYKADLVEEFDPSIVLGTLYTEKTGTKADQYDIAGKIAILIAARAGEKLLASIFTAVRNPAGNTSAELYNGFDKLVDLAIADSTVSVAKKNYVDISATPFTVQNVGDLLKAQYKALDRELKKKCKLYIPVSIREMYEEWFQQEFGHVPWNEGMEQRYLIGTKKQCELVDLNEMEEGKYLYFTQKENMCFLFDMENDKEKVEIRRVDNPKVVQMFMITFFGVGIDTVEKEFFKAVKYSTVEAEDLTISNVAKTDETVAAANDGTITVTATGGVTPIEYSKDNGATWQDTGAFTGLADGNYTVKVRDKEHNVVAYATNPVVIAAGS